ncbi:MAG: GWxTD domain-containing protein [Candidatus Eisenbacteria bacterium]|nr:GWxTD domain-containing protein [Candidatus Eisenbacteria bacterium]
MPSFHLSGQAVRRIGVPAFAAAAVLLVATGALASGELQPLRSLQPPLFTADVAVALDSTAHPTVEVTFTLPYAEISWNKLQRGYAGGAGFSIVFEPSGGRRLFGDSWEKRLLVESYGATRNQRNQLVVRRSFDLPPGRYRIRARVRDVSSWVESEADDQLDLADLANVPVGFSDLQLGTSDSSGKFTPVATRRFGDGAIGLTARAVALDRRAGEWPRLAKLHWRISEAGGEVVQEGDTTLTLRQEVQPVELRPRNPGLFIGDYLLEVERVEGKSRWRTSRTFEVEESGPPRGKEYALMLEALSYIAQPKEIDAMRNLPEDQQAEAWERFWARRDPTPETPVNENLIEFYRRLRHANRQFQGIGPGWRSDMGRIYIRYGPPDQVESQPGSATSPTIEIWYYHQPYHRFVFADREGFGRYTLLNPEAE